MCAILLVWTPMQPGYSQNTIHVCKQRNTLENEYTLLFLSLGSMFPSKAHQQKRWHSVYLRKGTYKP